MAVRIGKIDLAGLSNVHTEDTRSLVQQRGPGQSGSVIQDLGREPVTIVMEGVLVGDNPQEALEELRSAQMKAKPLSFAADAIAGADLTEVIVSDFQVKQLAGYKDRYSFFLRVREYTEPPAPPGAGLAAVDGAVSTNAASWAQSSMNAASVLQNPGSLMQAVTNDPGLLGHLSSGELGSVLSQAKDKVTGGGFGKILGELAKIDPMKVIGLVNDLRNSKNLGDFITKLAGDGVDILKQMTGIDLGTAVTVLKGIAGASDFLSKLQKVAKDGEHLAQTIGGFDPVKELEGAVSLGGGGS
jgi:hypothetical protein